MVGATHANSTQGDHNQAVTLHNVERVLFISIASSCSCSNYVLKRLQCKHRVFWQSLLASQILKLYAFNTKKYAGLLSTTNDKRKNIWMILLRVCGRVTFTRCVGTAQVLHGQLRVTYGHWTQAGWDMNQRVKLTALLHLQLKLRMCGAIQPSPSTHQPDRPIFFYTPAAYTCLLTKTCLLPHTHCTNLSPYTETTAQTYLLPYTCSIYLSPYTDLSPSTHPLHKPVSLHRNNCTDLSPSTHPPHRPTTLHIKCTDLSPYTDRPRRRVSFQTPTAQTCVLTQTLAYTYFLPHTHRTDLSLYTDPPHSPVSFHTPAAQTFLLTQTHCTDMSSYTDLSSPTQPRHWPISQYPHR